MQNNPDVNSPNIGDESETDIERDDEITPTPPDREPNVPVEEPPETERVPIEDGGETEPQRIV